MKKYRFSTIAVVIIVSIVLYFLYHKKIKTQLPPVSLPWPDKPGGSGGGGGGSPDPLPVDPPPPVKTDPIIPTPIPRVKFKPPIPLGIDAIQPPEPGWRAKRISNNTDQTLNVAIGTGFKFGTRGEPTGDMTTINHLYNGSGKRSKIYDVSPFITWP